MYVNKIENRITFKIQTGILSRALTPEANLLFGSTKSKITKNKKGENVLQLEITEAVLVHFKLSTIIINKIQEFSIHLFLIICLVNYFTQHCSIF